MAANRQIIIVETFFAGVATFAMPALFHTAQPDGTKTVGATLTLLAPRNTIRPAGTPVR
jgi:hypothetical protein